MHTIFFRSYSDISVKALKEMNIKCILLDIDNTIKPYGGKTPHCGVFDWIQKIKKSGIKVILCSNNYKNNVKPIADLLNCEFVSFCLKPSPFGFLRAKIKSKVKCGSILVVGDQVFTDILGGKLLFFKTALVDPIDRSSEGKTVKIRRILLRHLTEKIKNRENPYMTGDEYNE